MAVALAPASSACATALLVSGFETADPTSLSVFRVPAGPSTFVPPLLRGGAGGVTRVCRVGSGWTAQRSFSAPPQSPGGYNPATNTFLVSVNDAITGSGVWLSVNLATCSHTSIPASAPLPGDPAATASLSSVQLHPPSGLFLGVGRAVWSNGTSAMVAGAVDPATGTLHIAPGSLPDLGRWGTPFQSLSALDVTTNTLFWVGASGVGNDLVGTDASSIVQAVQDRGETTSRSRGHFCQDHTDDFAGVGCPYALGVGGAPHVWE